MCNSLLWKHPPMLPSDRPNVSPSSSDPFGKASFPELQESMVPLELNIMVPWHLLRTQRPLYFDSHSKFHSKKKKFVVGWVRGSWLHPKQPKCCFWRFMGIWHSNNKTSGCFHTNTHQPRVLWSSVKQSELLRANGFWCWDPRRNKMAEFWSRCSSICRGKKSLNPGNPWSPQNKSGWLPARDLL